MTAPGAERRDYSDAEIAEALAQVPIHNGNVQRTAAVLGIPERTLSRWAHSAGVATKQQAEPLIARSGRISQLWGEYLEASLRATLAAVEVASDPAWLRQQNAHDLAILVGVLQDKARLLSAAAAEAARALPAPADDAAAPDTR